MSINKLGGSSSDNWELISSVTPTVSTAAVNFTGLAVYRKLLVMGTGIVLLLNGSIRIRLNNDSAGVKYLCYGSSATTYSMSASSSWEVDNGSNTAKDFYLIVSNCDTASIKVIDDGGGQTDPRVAIKGIYLGSAAVSQVNVITGSTFTAVGTVSLYGVK